MDVSMKTAATRILLCLGALLLLGAAPRESERKEEPDFWSNIVDPGRKKFLLALGKGRGLFDAAVNMRSAVLRRRTFEDALAAFQEATRHSPRRAEGWFWAGKTLYRLDRNREAIVAFGKVRRLDPNFADDYTIAFALGIAYSKVGSFEGAVQEYDRAIRILSSRGQGSYDARQTQSILQANAAESLMALGRLDEAIQRYQEALSLHSSHTLAWWGLAVALDRDEQTSKAFEAATRALSGDQDMRSLTSPDVFFIPVGDIHYYYGLGKLTKGDRAGAQQEFQEFLRVLPGSAWAARARAHLARLGGAVDPKPRRKGLAPRPTPGVSDGDSALQDQQAIRYRVQSYLYGIRQCYQKELKQKAGLAGQLRVSFTVTKDGRAQEIKVVSSTLRRPSLHTCVVNALKGIYFSRPSGGKPVKITYPFEFKAGP
jgi:TonB family protein